jgi:hypothetical protein
LAKITIANGYSRTVKKVDHARTSPFLSYDIPAINYWTTGFSVQDAGDRAFGDDRRVIPVYIEGYCVKWEDGAQEEADKFAADIITSLYRKTTAPKVSDNLDRNLNELVAHMRTVSVQYIVDQSSTPYCGVLVQFDFEYFAKLGDMFTIDNN